MKATSVTVSLDTRRPRKDGTFPVILRLTHNSKTTSIKTGIYLQEKDWDAEARIVKRGASGISNVTRLNNEIQKKKADALDDILKLQDKAKKTPLSLLDVKDKIAPTSATHSFYEYGEKLVQDLRKAERIGTARSYEGTLSVLKTFNKGKPIEKPTGGDPKKKVKLDYKGPNKKVSNLAIEEINYTFLKAFETYHLACGNGWNGLAVYMRNIRSIYNQAVKDKLVDRNHYAFTEYKIKTVPTQKRALEADWLNAIISRKLTPEEALFNERNYFVASYMMYGMNFADMAHLKKTDIVGDRIHYRRRKTSKLYDIKISDGLNAVLSYYINQQPDAPYVFPIIKRDGALFQSRDIQWARKKYNKKLKELAEVCGINKNLTSYVSRHSFATNAMLNQVPLNAISTMLGHSSLKTTQIYLDSLPTKTLDHYNSLIIGNG